VNIDSLLSIFNHIIYYIKLDNFKYVNIIRNTNKRMEKKVVCPNCSSQVVCNGDLGEKKIVTCAQCGSQGIVLFPIKKTVACPQCKKPQTCEGITGEKKILICETCGTKGLVLFTDTNKQPVKPKKIKRPYTNPFSFKLSKKQIATFSISLILIVALLITVIAPTARGDMHFLTVMSGSMEPYMHVGDVVISSTVNPHSIKVGDVITFQYDADNDPNRYVTHRVINISTTDSSIAFKTKGDANEDPDAGLVQSSRLVGKVIVVLPYLGHLGTFARSKAGYVVFLVIPALLIIIHEVIRIVRIKKSTLKKHESVKRI
jgi:signal peptidase